VGQVWTFWRIGNGLVPAGIRAPDRSCSSMRSEWFQEPKLEAADDNEKEQKFTSKLNISVPVLAIFGRLTLDFRDSKSFLRETETLVEMKEQLQKFLVF